MSGTTTQTFSNGLLDQSLGTSCDQKITSIVGKPDGYTNSILSYWRTLQGILKRQGPISLDGESLNLSCVVAVAKYGLAATVSSGTELVERVSLSTALLKQKLDQGTVIYGVNTGFGGSADTRTGHHETLQKALLQMQNSGVLLPTDRGAYSPKTIEGLKSHAVPVPIVRASMLTRCNSLLRGHSAVRMEVIELILTLLARGMTPIVPLRGSISASGDLSPLSYIAGTLEGNPDIYVHCSDHHGTEIVRADQALARLGLSPITLGPKEGLGLINGTAFSCGAGSLVMSEANQLALLSQILTAIGTEALLGSRGNFHPFIADVRPHPGQKEVASNIYAMLAGSKLISDSDPEQHGLAQDRYALRTASQWLGPQIENLALAMSQIQCELNSTTDNPLFDSVRGEIHHGGNFQATAVTSAVEKIMTAMQMIGKMIFSQCSEIINPLSNRGLPPNLCADDPSLSFALKGVDINMAAYMSELAYLAHPVSSYVQSAEMHNQSLNSLAFIATRYASEAVEVLSLMTATYLYVLCQALDLRALHQEFAQRARQDIFALLETRCQSFIPHEKLSIVQNALWNELMTQWAQGSTRDLAPRSQEAVTASVGVLFDMLSRHCRPDTDTPIGLTMIITQYKGEASDILRKCYATTRETFLSSPSTPKYLSAVSARFYRLVRQTLAVPIHKGLTDHPTYELGESHHAKKTIGSHISTIYTALRQGDLLDDVVGCLED
ncbi:uncharacterized protein N7459_005765 [Penicillium hispanicum]|uniref:uncharacterized protein n=1 Tax=Penicillium hispanicum TaxID=1080232 RepID=UPI002541C291|nr:uncharacterized protein N7459_005765 [Penicillium hispanicum]KAJ5579780.1 hypothetical protein N7459_005765 [Penicillium hispanicum]